VYFSVKTPVLEHATPAMGVKPKQGCYVFWLFFKMGLFSALSFKRSRRELSIDVAEPRSPENKGVCVFWLFFKIGQCSGISFKRSRQELSIDVAQHVSILKKNGVVRI